MTENIKIKRFPKYLSGRAFSCGILLRGGDKQAVALKNKHGEIEVKVTNVKKYNTQNTVQAFINMVITAFSGIRESALILKKHKSFSVKRLFKYHGAEHKVIHCYEDGLELTVENAKSRSTYHPRCGTTLAADIIIIEGIICMLVPAKLRNALCGMVDVILFILAFFVGFKISRYASKHNNKFARIASVPGKLLQRVTALEPDDEMLQCGIEAAKKIVQSEY